jgi:hypothetical protein
MTAPRINQDTGTRRELFPEPRWHQLVFTTFSVLKGRSPLAFLQAPFPTYIYTIKKVLAVRMLNPHHHDRLQEEARADFEAGDCFAAGSLGNQLLLSKNADSGILCRHIRDDVKPGKGRPRPPNFTHHDLPLCPKSHIPNVSVNCVETRFQTSYCRRLRRGFHHTAPMGRQTATGSLNVGATLRRRLPF